MSIGEYHDLGLQPADLFLRLWDRAAQWSHVQRDDAVRRSDVVRALFDDLLMESDGLAAVEELIEALVQTEDGSEDRLRGSVLDALEVLDEVFLLIHPRTALIPPSKATRPQLPDWLVDARERRTLGRPYAQDEVRTLVPRGPFTTSARTVANLYGETLEDRFNALTAAPRFVEASGRRIEVLSRVIGHDAQRGVPPAGKATPRLGHECVGVVVVAERADDLEASRNDRQGGPHLDIRARSALPAAERLLTGINLLGDLDILLAPELTVSELEAGRFAEGLHLRATSSPRLSVAGSGGSLDADARGRRENVSIMFNAAGSELWRHCKIWPYAMTPSQVSGFRWDPISADQMLAEDLVDGNAITFADLDGLGRVVTLICQDFQINPGVAEAIRMYQPDWVLVPVLDSGTDFGRWTHQRAYELSGLSNSRFVVASSLALAEQAGVEGYPDLPVAVMVGPKDPPRDGPVVAIPRAVGTIKCQFSEPMCGRLGWAEKNDAWSQTILSRPDRTAK